MIVMKETATEEEVDAVVEKIERAGAIAHRLEIQADVQVCVEDGGRTIARGGQHGIRLQAAAEQIVDLPHGDARVGANGEQRRARGAGRFGARHAEKMPRGILHVVRIHRPVRFELETAVPETPDAVAWLLRGYRPVGSPAEPPEGERR